MPRGQTTHKWNTKYQYWGNIIITTCCDPLQKCEETCAGNSSWETWLSFSNSVLNNSPNQKCHETLAFFKIWYGKVRRVVPWCKLRRGVIKLYAWAREDGIGGIIIGMVTSMSARMTSQKERSVLYTHLVLTKIPLLRKQWHQKVGLLA